MGHHPYRFIEPNRPEPQALRDTLLASLAATVTAPRDLAELAGAIFDLSVAMDNASGAVLDADTDGHLAAAKTVPALLRFAIDHRADGQGSPDPNTKLVYRTPGLLEAAYELALTKYGARK
jgi:hypothetical protein